MELVQHIDIDVCACACIIMIIIRHQIERTNQLNTMYIFIGFARTMQMNPHLYDCESNGNGLFFSLCG